MASKYTLNDLPTSGRINYRGKDYPIWDVDGIPVSTKSLWIAAGMESGGMNEDAKPVDDAIIVWTDETEPIDGICTIAAEQGGSGTAEKIVKDIEKRIEDFNGLVLALEKWHTGIDRNDGATAGLWDWIPMSLVPDSTDHDWYDRNLCDAVDQYIGTRHDLNPEVTIDDLFNGNADAVSRLHAWAKTRAQEIYDGCKVIGEELKETKVKEEEKRIKDEAEKQDRIRRGELQIGLDIFALYDTPNGIFGYHYRLEDSVSVDQFLDFNGTTEKLIRVYKQVNEDYETYYKEMPVDEAVKIAQAIEEYFISKEGK